MTSKKKKNIRACPHCGDKVWKDFHATMLGLKSPDIGRPGTVFWRAYCQTCGEIFTPEEFEEMEEYK